MLQFTGAVAQLSLDHMVCMQLLKPPTSLSNNGDQRLHDKTHTRLMVHMRSLKRAWPSARPTLSTREAQTVKLTVQSTD
jgi:hypothetical protein